MQGRSNYFKVFLLGFGFLSISLLWSIYNTDIPIILQETYKISSFAVGWIMNLDNILAIIIIPIIGALSDRTWTKIGRRMPYIITSLPISAILFCLIPWIPLLMGVNIPSLFLLIFVIFLMNITQAIGRSPFIALMPDIVFPENRSPANGIINFMGGLGALIAFFFVGRLSSTDRTLGFLIVGIVQIIAVIILFLTIREKRDSLVPVSQKQTSWSNSFKYLMRVRDKSLIFLLLAIFFWFVGFNTIETFYTVYMAMESGLLPSQGESIAKFNLGILALSFMVMSIPSGVLAKRIGRKRTVIIGILGIIGMFIGLMITKDLSVISILFLIGGISWALININALPMVLDLGSLELQGTFTGMYYLASQSASIIAPPLTGFLADLLHTRFIIFPLGGIFSILALLMILQVKDLEMKERG
ncbi:MAG TPA: MFS transporter [Dictyoglomaceae bacterium]|nr:MFS transporter [Dictyoglomaceae bacterium]HOL39242.1 MFS transporter [Dictyoglomaceae bacterium]